MVVWRIQWLSLIDTDGAYVWIKLYVMMTYVILEVFLHGFFTSALYEDEWSALRSDRFTWGIRWLEGMAAAEPVCFRRESKFACSARIVVMALIEVALELPA